MHKGQSTDQVSEQFLETQYELLAWMLHGFSIPAQVIQDYKSLGSELQRRAASEVPQPYSPRHESSE